MNHRTHLNRAAKLFLLGLGCFVGSAGQGQPASQSADTLNRQLIAAIDHNDTAVVCRLLQQGADPNTRIAAAGSRLVWGDRSLERRWYGQVAPGASPSSVLMKAIEWHAPGNMDFVSPITDNVGTIQALVEAGADVNERVTDLDSDARWDEAEAPRTTALIEAAYRNKWKVMRVLVAHGADVNAADDFRTTALMYAAQRCERGSEGTVKLLLEHGADVNARDDQGEPALIWFSDPGEDQRHRNGLKFGSNGPRFSKIDAVGTPQGTVWLLLRYGAAVNIPYQGEYIGNTLLYEYRHDRRISRWLKRMGMPLRSGLKY